ncbi:hypothetical protein BDR04DRAFT_1147547 [Suillus decipiens]|nr:hypothetical protein BDR04DRAFT_1147547 [Suillus decipiens]
MSPPISEDSKSNTNSWIKRLRVDCLLSISRFASGNTSSGNSDEPRMIPDPTTSSTGSESSGIVSPLSLSGFESPSPLVACEDLQYVGLPSSLTQPCPKIDIDVGKYHDGPRDLTCYITRIDDNPCGHGGSSNVSRSYQMSPEDVAVKAFIMPSRNSEDTKNLIEKLRQEVFVWQKLKHSHILPLYGITNKFGDIPALVCPWMKRGSLQQYLEVKWEKQSTISFLFSSMSF